MPDPTPTGDAAPGSLSRFYRFPVLPEGVTPPECVRCGEPMNLHHAGWWIGPDTPRHGNCANYRPPTPTPSPAAIERAAHAAAAAANQWRAPGDPHEPPGFWVAIATAVAESLTEGRT